eukprot:scaffold17083_cov89-Phaeocystis_antarctica.AAC.2
MSGFGASLRCWLLHTAQHRWAGSAARAARSRGALTVRDGAIEIDSREAVSRFLNVLPCYHFITPVLSSWLQTPSWDTGGLPHAQMP